MLRSIRWRLPLSYAGIALLATLSLGAVLLPTLRNYYAQQEVALVMDNAIAISTTLARMQQNNMPEEEIQAQISALAFLAQMRIQLLDTGGSVLYEARPPADAVFRLAYNATAAQAVSGGGTIAESFDTFINMPDPNTMHLDSASIPALPGQPALQDFTFIVSDVAPVTQVVGGLESTADRIRLLSPNEGDIAVSVERTPFGVGLNTERSAGRISDQAVMMPILDVNGVPTRFIRLSNGPAFGMEILDSVAHGLVGAGAAAIIIAGAVGWLISRQISQPVLQLTGATAAMAQGDLKTRVALQRGDELGKLANAFNDMAARVDDTVHALRRFIADAAHELHTPLTALHADLELAATEPDEAQRLVFIRRARAQAGRLETLANNLLDLSRLESGGAHQERARFDVVALAREVSEIYASRAEQLNVQYQFDVPNMPVMLVANEVQIRRALCNLLDNAIKFTPENGVITVGVRAKRDCVELWVNDTGVGIPPEDLPHLFSRFHRGRNAAAFPGNGLGLAITRAIVEGHHGHVHVESVPGRTCFALTLPLAA
jgi:signal transduction histidine kinase